MPSVFLRCLVERFISTEGFLLEALEEYF